jgi:competence protein ComEC
MEQLRTFPIVRVTLPVVSGVVTGAFLLELTDVQSWPIMALGTLWSILVAVLIVRSVISRETLHNGASFMFCAFIGGLLLVSSVTDRLYPAHLVHAQGSESIFLVTVEGEAQEKPKSLRILADATDLHGRHFGKVLLYLAKDSVTEDLGHGDRLLVRANLNPVEPVGNPNEFNYARYLRFHHIYHQSHVRQGQWELLETDQGSIRRLFINLRRNLLSAFQRAGLDGQEFAVASALVLGYKADLEQSLVQAYAGAGATHVLAVSGLHVGIIYLVVNWLLGFLTMMRHGERIRAVLNVLILFSYAALTGLSPSVTRAATMFASVALAKAFDRRVSIYNTLASSAFVLMIYDPLIVMQVGFQLSYAAVLGIVTLQPWLFNQYTPKGWLADKIWEITCVSVAAQIATFPLGLLYFHQFPNLFFVSNLFVIPAATGVLVLGIGLMAAQVWGPLLAFCGFLMKWLIRAMNALVGLFDHIPYAVTSGIDISVVETLLIYTLIIATAYMLIQREPRMLLSVTIIIGLLVASQTIEYHELQRQRSLTVYNIRKQTALSLMEGTSMKFIASTELQDNKQSLLFHVTHHWWARGVKNEQLVALDDSILNRPFKWLDKTVIIVGKSGPSSSLEMADGLDVAIIHSVNWKDIQGLAQQLPKLVVFSSALGHHTRQEIRKHLPDQTEVWDAAQQGAFTLHL